MNLVNLTPHEVVLVDGDNNVIVRIPSSGVARAQQRDTQVGVIMLNPGRSIPVVETEFGHTEGLPEPTKETAFIVSIITLNAARAQGRPTNDLFITNGLVRDDAGVIIGCRALARA